MSIKIGFVGTGGIANSHLGGLSKIEGVQITALSDIVEGRAQQAAERWKQRKKEEGLAFEVIGTPYTNYKEMYSKEDLDAVYVCLPPNLHGDVEIDAAKAGLHLFVEKPVNLYLEKGIEAAEAIDKAGVITSVGYQSRYSNNADAAKKFLANKTIGMVVAEDFSGVAGGDTHWWRVMERSGGKLHEQTTHQLDMIRFLAGDIVEVFKYHALRINTNMANHTIPDLEIASFVFESGALGVLTVSCAMTQGGGHGKTEFLLEGHIIMHYPGLEIVPAGVATIEVENKPIPSIDQAFVDAVRSGDSSQIRSTYKDGLKTTAVTLAANQSAKEGKPVAVARI
jgi:predicted dehydrogenase